jgi:small subunit ribosomal protein S8
VQLASKPGQRKYVECSQIPKVLNGLGCALLTTTKGVLSGSEAKKAGIGGELLFTIW